MKTTTAERDPQSVRTLRELIEDIAVAMMVTVTPEGELRSRPMFTADVREEGELSFFTADDAGLVQDLAEESAVNLCYADPQEEHYVSVSGQATVVHDRDTLAEHWADGLTRYFPQGLAEPGLALVRVRITTAEYWDGGARKMTKTSQDPDRPAEDQVDRPSSRNAKSGADPHDGGAAHTVVDIRATPASG